MNNQRPLAKSKQTSNNHQFHAFFPSSMNNNKENLFKDIFYMDPLLIENLTQEELRTHLILSEYKLLKLYGQDLGIYGVPQLNNLSIWYCVIFIRAGLYKDGKFKFTMEFTKDFPTSKPVVKFQNSIYHPLINPKNFSLDMNFLFPNWKYGTSHLIFTIFSEIKNIFTDINYLQVTNSINPEGNQEAAFKFGENIEEFYMKVQEDVEISKSEIFENSQFSSLKFKEFNTEHEKIKNKLEELTKEEMSMEEKKKLFLNFLLEGESNK